MNNFYKEMRCVLLEEYKKYKNKASFDDFLFKNHLFYLLPESYSSKVKCMIFFNKIKKQLQEKYIGLLNKFADKNAITIIFVKGIILANQLYDNPRNRFSSDIDILVNKKDILLVENFLIKEGFRKETDKTGFHSSFIKTEKNNEVIIEVHNKLFVLSADAFSLIKSIPIKKIHTRKIEYNEQQFYVLNHTYEFLYLFIHILRHFIDGTIHSRLYLLSKYPISKIIELVLYINKYNCKINWLFIKNYLNKLHIGTLINNFFKIISYFIPTFNMRVNEIDSVSVFKNTTFFELYLIISKFPSFDYIFYIPNQLWAKAISISNSKKQKLIGKKIKNHLVLQTKGQKCYDFSNFTVSVNIRNDELIFSLYFPKNKKFEKRRNLLWQSDTLEIILFNINSQKTTFYHRFFVYKNKTNDIEIYEDDYRKYTKDNFYNEILINKGIKGKFQKYKNENCISIFIKPKLFGITIKQLLFDIAININKKNEYIKLSLNENNPEKYLLPINFSRIKI